MDGKKGVLLLKWNTICLPQVEGDLGIHDIVNFNTAGMMKLADSSALFAQFFKHCYFSNCSIWETIYTRYSSYAWKGIRIGLSHLKDNVRWVIGDVQLVDFWADPWLSEKSIWDSYGTIVHQELEVVMPKISDHIRVVPQSWVLPLPTSGFFTLMWKEVQNNILPLQPHRDFLVWINFVSGLFSIKEAWEHIRNKGTSQPIFRTLWSAKCHPRAKWFFWLALHHW
ncbi:hypothetical protein AMTRI_Chr02g216530 [Amborella trichopoda]